MFLTLRQAASNLFYFHCVLSDFFSSRIRLQNMFFFELSYLTLLFLEYKQWAISLILIL